jgi:hypothetical protein
MEDTDACIPNEKKKNAVHIWCNRTETWLLAPAPAPPDPAPAPAPGEGDDPSALLPPPPAPLLLAAASAAPFFLGGVGVDDDDADEMKEVRVRETLRNLRRMPLVATDATNTERSTVCVSQNVRARVRKKRDEAKEQTR